LQSINDIVRHIIKNSLFFTLINATPANSENNTTAGTTVFDNAEKILEGIYRSTKLSFADSVTMLELKKLEVCQVGYAMGSSSSVSITASHMKRMILTALMPMFAAISEFSLPKPLMMDIST
jgi:hypothetical protein